MINKRKPPILSIIIPVYKVEQFLNRCVDSVILNSKEHIKDIEIILVDDGSPDNCPKICDEYAEKYDFISVIHKQNGGVSSARNAGIDNAKGEYITFIDSDDYVNEEFYKLFSPFTQNKEVDLFQFGINVLEDNKKKEIAVGNKKLSLENKENVKYIFQDIFENCINKVYKLSFLLKNNIRFEAGRKSEDFLFSIKAILSCKFFLSENIKYYMYFRNAFSVTHTYTFEGLRDAYLNYDKALKLIDDFGLSKNSEKLVKRYINRWALGDLCQLNFMTENDRKESISFLKGYRKKIYKPFSKKQKILFYIYKLFGLKAMLNFVKIYQKIKKAN